jgi:hypothetical protein
MCDDEEVERENAEWRIREGGLGAELVRKMALARLQQRWEAFCAHGSVADLVALEFALELAENAEWSFHRAVVIESLLKVLRVDQMLTLGSENTGGAETDSTFSSEQE